MVETRAALEGDRTLAYATLAPSVVFLLLLAGVPTITVFVTAMQDVGMGEMSGPYVGFENFLWVLTSEAFYTALWNTRSEEHTSELQSRQYLACRLLLEKK